MSYLRVTSQDDITDSEVPDLDLLGIVSRVSAGATLLVDGLIGDDVDTDSFMKQYKHNREQLKKFRDQVTELNHEAFEIEFISAQAKLNCRVHGKAYTTIMNHRYNGHGAYTAECPFCKKLTHQQEQELAAEQEAQAALSRRAEFRRAEQQLAQQILQHEELIAKKQAASRALLASAGVNVADRTKESDLFDEQGRFNPITKYGRLF